MKENIGTWIIAGIMGLLLLLLLNTSPLSRLGFSAELPFAWQNVPTDDYKDASCSTRKPEGIPFTFKRPNHSQTCAFDINKLALILNGAIGLGLGVGCVLANRKHPYEAKQKSK